VRPSARTSVAPSVGRGLARQLSNPAQQRIARAYQPSRGMPSAENSGSGCRCHRSITTHAASHAAPSKMIRTAGLPRGAASTLLRPHKRASVWNHVGRAATDGSPPSTRTRRAAPRAVHPLPSHRPHGAGRAERHRTLQVSASAAPESCAYFAARVFLRLSKPAWYTPVITSVAALSFSVSAGSSPRSLRLNRPDQVTSVLLSPREVITRVDM